MPETYTDTALLKRPRATKACDMCRSRKLKCDGNSPCHRCVAGNVNCLYTHVLKRKKAKMPKAKKSNTIQMLNDRITNLEGLLTTLVTKLDPDSIVNTDQDTHTGSTANEFSPSSEGSSPETTTNYDGDGNPHSESDHSKEFKEHPGKYFGPQSSFSILGPRGIEWLARISGDTRLVPKFIGIYRQIQQVTVTSVTRWTEALDKHKLVPFSPQETVKPITEVYFEHFGRDNLIIKEEDFLELFDLYYLNVNKKQPHAKELTSSDLLILNSIIAVGAFVLVETTEDESKIENYKKINRTHLDMAIYYYHKVCIISEGIKSIQGILLLNLNAEISPFPQMCYALVSTAVRQAQEIGLHRAEYLTGISKEEATKRYKLWYNIHVLDSNMCLRSGKPPIINNGDVTHLLSEDDSYEFSPKPVLKRIERVINSPGFNPNEPKYKAELDTLKLELRSHPLKIIMLNYYTKLTTNASYTYDRLFKARALIGKSTEEIMDVIEELNERLEHIRLEIPKLLRPDEGNYVNDVTFQTDERYDYMMLHFQYYLQVLIINRMAFNRSWLNDDLVHIDENSRIVPKQQQLMRKCLRASRSILKIYLQMQNFVPLFFSVSSFYFYSAFFALFVSIVEDSDREETKNDILLIEDAFKIFLEKIKLYGERFSENLTSSAFALSLKLFLKIAMSAYNRNHPDDVFDVSELNYEIEIHDKLLNIITKESHASSSFGQSETSEQADPQHQLSQNRLTAFSTNPTSQDTGNHSYPDRQTVFDPVRQSISGAALAQPSAFDNNGFSQMQSHAAAYSIPNKDVIDSTRNNDPFNPSYSFNDPPLQANFSFEQFGFPDWDIDSAGNLLQQSFTALPNYGNAVYQPQLNHSGQGLPINDSHPGTSQQVYNDQIGMGRNNHHSGF